MSDDLKKRLLDWEMWDEGDINDTREEAHARIEELCVLHREYEKILTERIEELEAKLDNTADAIRAEFKDKFDGERKYALRQIVKWLKGERDE